MSIDRSGDGVKQEAVHEAADMLVDELGIDRAEAKLQSRYGHVQGREAGKVLAALARIRKRKEGEL